MPFDKDAAYSKLRDLRAKMHGFVYDSEHRLEFHHRRSGVMANAGDPKMPYHPLTDELYYGDPPNIKALRLFVDYIGDEWSPLVTVSISMTGISYINFYSGEDVAQIAKSIGDAIGRLKQLTD